MGFFEASYSIQRKNVAIVVSGKKHLMISPCGPILSLVLIAPGCAASGSGAGFVKLLAADSIDAIKAAWSSGSSAPSMPGFLSRSDLMGGEQMGGGHRVSVSDIERLSNTE
eukprot:Selendium_serpulae@DN6304_c1_g2_i6.p2